MGKLAGTWNKTKSENGPAFFTAFDVPADQQKRAGSAALATTIAVDGKSMTVTRKYTEADGNVKTDVNSATLGVESEFTGPRGNKYMATVTIEGDKLQIAGSGGAVNVTMELQGDVLIETMTGKGLTFQRWHARA